MGILDFIFGPGKRRQPAKAQPSQPPNSTRNATRRELVRVALRDTLVRHGVPVEWVGVETLSAITRGREPGLHMRLILRHWEPQLLACGVALQKNVAARVLLLDPLAATWLTGISWQFSPADESLCAALPGAGHWKRPAAQAAVAGVPAAPVAKEPQAREERKAALNRMLAGQLPGHRDEDDHPEFSATRPMFGFTEPGRL